MKEGQRFGKLVLIRKVSRGQKKPQVSAKWLCSCDCGKEKTVTQNCLQIGSTRSCGCLINRVSDDGYNERIKVRIQKTIKIDEKKCWLWIGAKHRQGYAIISYKRKPSLGHRVSWMVYKGEIPESMKICHICDVTSCVNPEHLFLGSQKENVKDAVEKGKFYGRNLGKRRTKLNWDQVQSIRNLHSKGIDRKELQQRFRVGQTCIAKILTGRSWNTNWTEEL